MSENVLTARVSGGHVALPVAIQYELGIRDGDALDATIEDGRLVLAPREVREKKPLTPQIVKNPVLGTPMLTFGPDAPILTSEEVAEILAEFP